MGNQSVKIAISSTIALPDRPNQNQINYVKKKAIITTILFLTIGILQHIFAGYAQTLYPNKYRR